MDCVAVTLSSPLLNGPRDVLLPLDIPQYVLIEAIIEALGLNVSNKYRGFLSSIEDGKRKVLPWQRTLREAGLKFGQFIVLEFREVSARAFLKCLEGPEFDLDKDEMILGCRSDMDIDLRSIPKQEFVSGRHAKIYFEDGFYYISDLGSTNGTKVNGTLVTADKRHILRDGDEILLGLANESAIQLVFQLRK